MEAKLKKLFDLFKSRNLEVYLVGGACRDMSNIKDYDFASPHTPTEIKTALADIPLSNLSANAENYGTVMFNINNSVRDIYRY